MREIIDHIKEHAKEALNSHKGCHDWSHTQRVYNLCVHIGKKEKADTDVLEIAAILHDIARDIQTKNKGKICHAQKGAEMARGILLEYDIPEKKMDNIIHCIKTHRFRGNDTPQTKEARILFDADKLDAIGAIGIARAFHFSGEIGSRVHDKNIDVKNTKEYSQNDTAYREFLVKLHKVKDRVLTNEGRRIAQGRHAYMIQFFERLNNEVDGIL
jgi:uncharacterized protein